MQSAFAGPSTQQYDSKQYFHWSATYIGTGAAAEGSAAAAAAALQQQLAQQGFPSTGGSMQHPETPAAQTAHENPNQLWQVRVACWYWPPVNWLLLSCAFHSSRPARSADTRGLLVCLLVPCSLPTHGIVCTCITGCYQRAR